MSSSQRMIVGCGYVGQPLAQFWNQRGDVVFTTTRSTERARQFAHQGFQPLVADVTNPESLRDLREVDTAVYAVGYDSESGKTREEVYADGLQNVLDKLPHSCGRLIFVSTTGVFGDAEGKTVDETTPCDPARAGGKAFLLAEERLRNHPIWGNRSITLRMAGIYGPGRVPRSSDIREGKPIPAASGGALNLIHVNDAVQAIHLAAEAETFSPLYIVSDGHPVDRRDYYREVARLLDAPEPTFEEPEPNSPSAARAKSDRKMSNRRLVEELGFVPKYPSYREGLSQILS